MNNTPIKISALYKVDAAETVNPLTNGTVPNNNYPLYTPYQAYGLDRVILRSEDGQYYLNNAMSPVKNLYDVVAYSERVEYVAARRRLFKPTETDRQVNTARLFWHLFKNLGVNLKSNVFAVTLPDTRIPTGSPFIHDIPVIMVNDILEFYLDESLAGRCLVVRIYQDRFQWGTMILNQPETFRALENRDTNQSSILKAKMQWHIKECYCKGSDVDSTSGDHYRASSY